MLLLISSNSTRRYGDDIVRALAQPTGTDFQFRYGLKYFEPSILNRLRSAGLAGEQCLIAFVEADKTARTTKFVICRAVTIRRSEIIGTSCILTLTASHYVKPLTEAELRGKLSAREADLLPVWKADPSYPEGKFVIDVSASIDGQQAAQGAAEMVAFEETAKALSELPTFNAASRIAFYAVRSLVTRDSWISDRVRKRQTTVVSMAGDRLNLISGYRYDIEIYSYAPAGGQAVSGAAKLNVESDDKAVQFTTSKSASLDSRYDFHRFTLTTDEQLNALPTMIRVFLTMPDPQDPKATEQRCDIVLPARFNGRLWLAASRVAVITAGIAIPSILGAMYKDHFNWMVGGGMALGALFAAYAAIFPIFKS